MEKVTRYNLNNIVYKDNNIYYLFSYDSLIAEYNKNNFTLTLLKKWCYSVTTLKYLYRFINLYCYDLTNIKDKKSFILKMIEQKKIKYKEA